MNGGSVMATSARPPVRDTADRIDSELRKARLRLRVAATRRERTETLTEIDKWLDARLELGRGRRS